MDLLKKKKKTEAQTVSDENTAMLPENKKSKSDLMTQRTNKFLVFIAVKHSSHKLVNRSNVINIL